MEKVRITRSAANFIEEMRDLYGGDRELIIASHISDRQAEIPFDDLVFALYDGYDVIEPEVEKLLELAQGFSSRGERWISTFIEQTADGLEIETAGMLGDFFDRLSRKMESDNFNPLNSKTGIPSRLIHMGIEGSNDVKRYIHKNIWDRAGHRPITLEVRNTREGDEPFFRSVVKFEGEKTEINVDFKKLFIDLGHPKSGMSDEDILKLYGEMYSYGLTRDEVRDMRENYEMMFIAYVPNLETAVLLPGWYSEDPLVISVTNGMSASPNVPDGAIMWTKEGRVRR
jgi:hypothetical protein